jgi:hypothetical protein
MIINDSLLLQPPQISIIVVRVHQETLLAVVEDVVIVTQMYLSSSSSIHCSTECIRVGACMSFDSPERGSSHQQALLTE